MWWNPKVEIFRREIRAFAEEVVAPVAQRMDETSEFDSDLLQQLRDRHLLCLLCPVEYGGPDYDTLTYVVAVEELSRICGSTGITVAAANSLGVWPVANFGSKAQKEMVLPGAVTEGHVIVFGLTEPGAGSDAGGTKSAASRQDGDWLLNGSKCFITNPHFAEWIIATAVTRPGEGKHGISSFVFHKSTTGFSVGKREHKLGLHGSDTATLHFDNIRLSAGALFGPEGEGFKQFMKTLDGGRIGIGAMALGLAQGALDIAIEYAGKRRQFGRPIADQQAIQWKLADMATQIEAARHLVYQAADTKDKGGSFARQSAMAKLYASEVGRFCTYQAIQILGGAGYMTANRVERHYRDVKLCEIGEGTSEIQRIVIARHLLKDFERAVEPAATREVAATEPVEI
ncbi:MAG: acyl-CoA dehydrogenase family protein [candidate division Zixibacteria bacterium]|nr:acyl-CoA dehydrogenase family protein [candidate division Zixibacteria bacterium]